MSCVVPPPTTVLPSVEIPLTTRLLVLTFVVAAIPVRLAPEPLKEVAVITPTASIPPARTCMPVRAVISPTESILVTSS